MDRVLEPLSNQWQIALLALIVVMGALVWRAQRQVTRLAKMTTAMQESLGRLEDTTKEVTRLTKTSGAMQEALTRLEDATQEITASSAKTEEALIKTEESVMKTEQVLKANLDEYRMALGSTNAYREYLQRMGLAPASDVEPILEAIPDGAEAVSTDGRVLYANKAFADLTSVRPGTTIEEIAFRCRVRTFGGHQLEPEDLPESRVLQGEVLNSMLIRMKPPGRDHDVILSVNGQPARDTQGKVVAAVMLCRAISEEVGMAIEVRRISEERPETAPGVV
ncbi:MAG TPA: PAS domain-containing protein [Actinomycetota bacterium]|jgi:PAS domain-containing protein|nr:PAS domain-containing protein [Actinomycetota bacterium]